MSQVETFIAKRYILSKRKARFINIIGFVSVVGIAVGVAALLIALSVFNGFNSVVTKVLVGFDPHLRVEKKGMMTTDEASLVKQELSRRSDLTSYASFVSGKAMLVSGPQNRVVFLRGVEDAKIGEVTGLKEKIIYGSLELSDSLDTPGLVIGQTLADRLMSVVGDQVTVISPSGFQSALSGMAAPQTMPFRITGIYESNNKDYDANYAYISIGAAQELFDADGKISGFDIRLKNFEHAGTVKNELSSLLPAGHIVSTWYDLHRTLYLVMNIERWSAYILLSLIIAVATFNMLGSLTMVVIEKRRDIAVLKAMGMRSRGIVRMFMFEGMLIGIAGTTLGIVIGMVVLMLQIEFQIFPLDTTIYIIPAIPVEIRWTDFVSIIFASMTLSFLAAYYPARRAASTLPAEALRWE